MYRLTNITGANPLLRKRWTVDVKKDGTTYLVRSGHSIRVNKNDLSLNMGGVTFDTNPLNWGKFNILLVENLNPDREELIIDAPLEVINLIPSGTQDVSSIVDDLINETKDDLQSGDSEESLPVVSLEIKQKTPVKIITAEDVLELRTHQSLIMLSKELGIAIEGFDKMKVTDKRSAIIATL